MDTLEQRLVTDLGAAADAADLTPPAADDVLVTVADIRRRRRIRTGLLVAAATVVIAGAASVVVTDGPSRTDTADNRPTTTPPDPITTAPSTTEQPTTTTTPTTTLAPTTTTLPPITPTRVAETIRLRANAIGAFEFGSPAADAATVTAVVNAELGAPIAGSPPVESPIPPCIDGAVDQAWRFSSEAVWPGLTAWFAGPDADSLYLVGYRASDPYSGGRAVDSTAVVRMAEGPTMADPVATWQAAYGTAMVDRNYDQAGTRMFFIHLADGRVHAIEQVREDGTRQAWMVDAGASCGGGD